MLILRYRGHLAELSQVNLNLMVALCHLHEQRSVSAAAAAAGVTQPAMSYNLKKLRDIFDDALFLRQGRQLVPTPTQEALIVLVRRGLAELERALAGPMNFEPETSNRAFRLVCNDYTEAVLMPRLLRIICQEAPGVCLELIPYNRASVRAFEAGEYEVLAGSDELPAAGDVRTSVMYRDPLVCIEAARASPLPLDLERYLSSAHIHVHVEREEGVADEILRDRGTTRRLRARVPNFASVVQMVVAGGAIATVPLAVVAHAPLRHAVDVYTPPFELAPITGRLFWHERYDNEPGTRWLLDLLKRVCAEIHTEIERETPHRSVDVTPTGAP